VPLFHLTSHNFCDTCNSRSDFTPLTVISHFASSAYETTQRRLLFEIHQPDSINIRKPAITTPLALKNPFKHHFQPRWWSPNKFLRFIAARQRRGANKASCMAQRHAHYPACFVHTLLIKCAWLRVRWFDNDHSLKGYLWRRSRWIIKQSWPILRLASRKKSLKTTFTKCARVFRTGIADKKKFMFNWSLANGALHRQYARRQLTTAFFR